MARQEIVRFIDDLDGSEAEGTVEFAFDGEQYRIDLSAANKERLAKTLEEFIAKSERVKAGKGVTVRSQSAKRVRTDNAPVREWARANGYEISDRGRVSKTIQEAYAQAQAG